MSQIVGFPDVIGCEFAGGHGLSPTEQVFLVQGQYYDHASNLSVLYNSIEGGTMGFDFATGNIDTGNSGNCDTTITNIADMPYQLTWNSTTTVSTTTTEVVDNPTLDVFMLWGAFIVAMILIMWTFRKKV